MKTLSVIIALCALNGCTDAEWSKLKSYGGRAEIECYSGTKLIYQGTSTGKINSSEQSDGYYFRDDKTGKLMEVSGNCVIRYVKE